MLLTDKTRQDKKILYLQPKRLYAMLNTPDTERQRLEDLTHIWYLDVLSFIAQSGMVATRTARGMGNEHLLVKLCEVSICKTKGFWRSDCSMATIVSNT